ncbi:MAG: endonuclease domain-containing protein [Nitrospinae bacterium]|nr:endonuclease domain-containing protein [Nitrospinota bacterium]
MPSKNRPYPLPYDKSLKEKARSLRSNPTPAEKLFWKALKQMPFYKLRTFYRQKPIGSYIVDFYCHRFRLVIEIDGHSHGETETKINDQKRTEYLESQGLTVLRFTNQEVVKNTEAVMAKLEEIISEQKIDVKKH